MEKGMILYQSKYGATEKYALWLREMTGFACVQTKKARVDEAASCETLILCGGVYASGIAGISFLKRNAGRLTRQRIAVLCVGASPEDAAALRALRERNLKSVPEGTALFYARGAWNERRMTLRDKALCRMLQKAVAKRPPDTLEPWMRALLEATGKPCDWTDKAYLQPLTEWLEAEKG